LQYNKAIEEYNKDFSGAQDEAWPDNSSINLDNQDNDY